MRLAIIEAFKNSRIPNLLRSASEPPLKYRRLELSLTYITRILSIPDDSKSPYYIVQSRF